MAQPLALKNKIVFDTSALHLCKPIWNAVKENCEIILSPRVAAEFSQNEIEYSVEKFTDADRKYVYEMIRRYLNKELATGYMKGRKGAHVGEFESIALAKRLKIPVVIHENRGRQWAKWEGAVLMHPIELPDTFHRKLPIEEIRNFLDYHCRMRYEPACEKLRKLAK